MVCDLRIVLPSHHGSGTILAIWFSISRHLHRAELITLLETDLLEDSHSAKSKRRKAGKLCGRRCSVKTPTCVIPAFF
jgi:hypothetical protein